MERNEEYSKIISKRPQYDVAAKINDHLIKQKSSKFKNDEIVSNRRGICNQIFVTGAILLMACACGMPIGYSAVLLPQLYNTSESISIDVEMGSWIASVHSLSTPFGSLVSGSIADRFGRRSTMLLSVIPLIIGWCTLATAPSYYGILLGRIVSGASVGILGPPAQIMIAEVAEPKLRGILVGAPYFSYTLGILIVYAMGSYFHWRHVAWYANFFPFIAAIAIYFIPESPNWLIRNGYIEKAQNALKFLRGNDMIAKRELNQMVNRLETESANSKSNENIFNLCLLPSGLKPLVIVNVFNILQLFSGTFLVVFYAIDIITEFGGDVEPKSAAIMTAIVRMICTLMFCFFLLTLKRRRIIQIAGIGSGISCLLLGIYMGMHADLPKTPTDVNVAAVCLISYIAFNTPLMVMPGIMVGELLPGKIRGRVAGWIFAVNNILLFGLTKIFPVVNSKLKTHGIFIIFGVASLLITVFMYLMQPETKDRSLDEIEDYFSHNKWFWFNRKGSLSKTNSSEKKLNFITEEIRV